MHDHKTVKRNILLFAGALFFLSTAIQGCIFISGKGLLSMEPRPLKETRISGEGKDKILLMEISGLITEQERGGFFSLQKKPSMVGSVKEQLEKAGRDEHVKGLILLVNSPGGTVTASDLIYHEIKGFKSGKKLKVVSLLMGTATSGAYYVSQAADRIVAHPTTLTGSIGVILMNLNFSGLMEKIGVSDASIKSGRFKDVGSPLRKPEKAGEEILQGVVDGLNRRFFKIVEENRPGVTITGKPELSDGRIFTAEQALENGLVDEIGYFPVALQWIKNTAGIPEARVIRYARGGEYLPGIYSLGTAGSGGQGDINLIKLDAESLFYGFGPTFMYLWHPGL